MRFISKFEITIEQSLRLGMSGLGKGLSEIRAGVTNILDNCHYQEDSLV